MPDDFDKTFDIRDFNQVLEQGVKDDDHPAPELEPETQDAEQPESHEETEREETEEEADDSALSEAEDAEPKVEAKGPKHRDTKAEARVAKLIKEKARLQGQLEALRYSQTGQQQQAQPQAVYDPDAPNPANYPRGEQDDDFRIDMKFYQRDVQSKVQTFQEQKQQMLKKYADELPELIEMDQERIASGMKTSNPTVFKLILESDQPGELWHYLLANSDQAISIAKMDPIRTAKAIGRIETKLAAEESDATPVADQKSTKRLPAPIRPVKTTTQNKSAATKNFGFVGY